MRFSNSFLATTAFGMIASIGAASSHAAFVGISGPGDEDATDSVYVVTDSGVADNGDFPVNLINGSGMTGNQDEGTAAPDLKFSLFRGTTGTNPGTVAGSHWVEFGFNQNFNLSNVHVWNWNETPYPMFGWKNLVIQTSLDGINWTTAFTGTIAVSNGANPSNVDLIAPLGSGSVLAKYVLLVNTGTVSTADDADVANHENWSSTVQDYTNDAGLSEVRFEIAVPEPASISLLGMGALALMGRRRRR